MRILHFSWDTRIPGVGGSTHEWNVARAFKGLGHNVRLVCEWELGNNVSEVMEGVDVRRVLWRTKIRWLNGLLLPLKAFANSFFQIFSFSPRIVYERYRIFGGYGVIVGRLFRKKTILEVNDPTVDAPYIEGRINFLTKTLAALWERFVFSCCDKIVTHHEVMAKRARKDKVLIVTNGVDTDEFNLDNFERTKWAKRFVCLFVGTFAKWQGVNTILAAARKLAKEKKILFVFAGDKRKKRDNTVFLGRVPYKNIPQLVANSDVCLYTPDTESYKPMKKLGFYFSPLKVFEYMSMAKPVIVSDAGNLKRLVKNGVNGYRISVNDSNELSGKILKLYNDKVLVKKMKKNNRRECVNKYSWKKIAEMILR